MLTLKSGALDEEKTVPFTMSDLKPYIRYVYAGSPFGCNGCFKFSSALDESGEALMTGHVRNSKGVDRVLSPANVAASSRELVAEADCVD